MSHLEPQKRTQRWSSPPRTVLTGCELEPLHGFLAGGDYLPIVGPDDDPQLALTYGGDGSLLGADRDFPNIPKCVIRRQDRYDFCPEHRPEVILKRLASGLVSVTKLRRLECEVNGTKFQALNDIVFHNAIATSAVRYLVRIDDQKYSDEVIGDGLIVATPFGSSAYFRSITSCVFRVGIGLAFNNSTESVHHLILDPASKVEIEVTRGPGIVFGDNMQEPIAVQKGDCFKIYSPETVTEIVELGTLTCHQCRERGTGRAAGFRHL